MSETLGVQVGHAETMFTLEELMNIRERAESLATYVANPLWQRKYWNLAMAADHIIARLQYWGVVHTPIKSEDTAVQSSGA